MSIQPDAPVQNPFLDRPAPALVPPPPPATKDEANFLAIGIGISAAFLAWVMIVKPWLASRQPRNAQEAEDTLGGLWKALGATWLAISTAPIKEAYSVVPYPEAETLAVAYATELGQYVNQTSAQALMEGFTTQINSGIGEGLAWTRSVNGYGLDPQQTKTYITKVMKADAPRYGEGPIPANVKAATDKALLVRADRLGISESHKAVQVGKNMVWMAMLASGDLPAGTMKKWVTANDERTCEVCGPLDQVTIPLHRRFKAINGERFYAPGVHPNCRCGLELVYTHEFDDIVKNMPGDPFNRDEDGQFARMEQRHNFQDEEIRPTLKPIQRQRLNPIVAPEQKETPRLQPLRRLQPVKRFSLQPLTAQETQVAQEVQEELEAAIEDDVKHAGWNWDTVAFVPGTVKGREDARTLGGRVEWDDLVRALASSHTQRNLIGKPVNFTRGSAAFVSRHRSAGDDEAFERVYKREAFEAAVNAQRRNANRNIPRGGVASARNIAPLLTDPLDVQFKSALDGLTNEQLVNIIDENLAQSLNDSQTISLIAPDQSHRWTRDEIRAYYEKKTPDETATAILMAYAREKSIINNEYQRDWNWTMEDVWTTHQKGPQAKAEAWRDGQMPQAEAVAVVYRMGNGWHGSNAGMGIGTVNNSYLISNITTILPPKHIQSEGTSLIKHLVVIDLVPHMENPFDDSNDFFHQTWSD